MRQKTCEILIVTYDALDLLKTCLPSIVAAAESSASCDAGVTVVENGGTDRSAEWVGEALPGVRFMNAKRNDYLYSLNWAAARSQADLVLILNNDVIMETGCIDPLIEPLLENPDVFSVSPKLLRFDHTTYDAGKRWGEFRRGFLHHSHDLETNQLSPTLFPAGAAFVVRRSVFEKIGGFDRLYHPGYWEDTELGFRAWKRGMVNLWSPESVMYHKGSASFGSLGSAAKAALHWRNSWLFTWHTVTDQKILAENALWTARYYIFAQAKRRKDISRAIQTALRKLPEALHRRSYANSGAVLSDREVCRNASINTWAN